MLLLFQPVLGGVPEYVANLADGLAARGWQLTVAAPAETPVLDRLGSVARNVIPIRTARGLSPRHDARVLRRLVGLCRSERIDLIHAHSSKAGAIAAIVGGLARVPTIYSPHAWSFQRDLSSTASQAYVATERLLARQHASVIAVSETERTEAERLRVVAPGAVELVHTGLHDATLPRRPWARARLGVDEDTFVVGWVGRTGPQKRSEHLPILAREIASDARLMVIGHGIRHTQIGDELEELDALAPDSVDPPSLYAGCDALAVTSRWEGFPLVVLEAMRAGLPVVAYNTGGVCEQVEHGVTGYLVEPGDVEGLADRLRELARDPVSARRMGDAGRQRVRNEFRFERMLTRIEETYRGVLGESTL